MVTFEKIIAVLLGVVSVRTLDLCVILFKGEY